jgi:hypothetical protein
MISIADLNDLDRNPRVAYDGYDDLRAEAQRRTRGPINPADLDVYAAVFRARTLDWCRSVLGHDVVPTWAGRGGIPWLEAEMLRVAHERGLDPPEPPWLIQWKAESAATQRLQDEALAAGLHQDRQRWAAALAASGVPADQLEVRANTRSSSQVRHGRRQALLHVVPLVNVRSARRRHPAGRELCAVSHARQLSDPVDGPATCVSCIRYTAEIRPDRSTP